MTVVRAQAGSLSPELIGDGGGLPFPPAALSTPASEPLDPEHPAVQQLLRQIDFSRKRGARRGFLRRSAPVPEVDAATKLAGWRVLAQTEGEILFARGVPPQLVTAGVTRRGEKWELMGVSAARPLRAVREGVRASSWRPDPDFTVGPDDTEIHILVKEQTYATGTAADDRILAPDLFADESQLVLRVYVKPLEGYVGRTRRHETAVTVQLPEPVGERELVDGAVYWAPAADPDDSDA